jgi:hypothetical protein
VYFYPVTYRPALAKRRQKFYSRCTVVVPGSQVVRQRILIPPYAGSTPARATLFSRFSPLVIPIICRFMGTMVP